MFIGGTVGPPVAILPVAMVYDDGGQIVDVGAGTRSSRFGSVVQHKL